jgi:hypothetical protein
MQRKCTKSVASFKTRVEKFPNEMSIDKNHSALFIGECVSKKTTLFDQFEEKYSI